MLTDIKSDKVYAKQLQYFPDNIAPVNMTPFTPAVEMHPYLDGLSCMLMHAMEKAGSPSQPGGNAVSSVYCNVRTFVQVGLW